MSDNGTPKKKIIWGLCWTVLDEFGQDVQRIAILDPNTVIIHPADENFKGELNV